MESGTPKLIDRLHDRGLVDQYGFLLFAVVGIVAILLCKFFDVRTWIIATCASLIIVGYALLVNMRGTAKLRSDQAGDNCYYLGLLYTLTSLGFAIFTFDPADTATTIVQGFGIALTTTIVGLMLRVFLNQSRVDLYQNEESARLELAEAAGRLKTELSSLALQFKDFTHGLQQSLVEVRDDARENISTAAEASAQSIAKLTETASDALTKQAEQLARSAEELSQRTASVADALERNRAALDGVTEAHGPVLENLERMDEASRAMLSNSEALAAQADSTSQAQDASAETIGRTTELVNELNKQLLASIERMGELESMVAARLKAIEEGPTQVADQALTAIAKAAEGVEGAMERLTRAQEAAIGSVGSTTGDLVQKVEQHNSALEAELKKSREHVEKVHSALVEMTAKLSEGME